MNKPQIIQLPKILDPRGNLTFVEANKHIPFNIKRTYWIYDVPGGEHRGGHAFKKQDQLIIALSGSFDVVVEDGSDKQIFSLNRSYYGLYVPKGTWRSLENFSTNAVTLVLSSTQYDEADYIRNYDDFLHYTKKSGQHIEDIIDIVKTIRTEKAAESVFDCSLFYLQRHHFSSGNLTPIEGDKHVPFPIKRVFYLYDIPGGESRGAHAHKECHQFLVSAAGAFEVLLDDGMNKRTVLLNRPYMGLHIPPGVWASEQGFSSSSICLVLASHTYDEADYIRNYNDYLNYKKQ